MGSEIDPEWSRTINEALGLTATPVDPGTIGRLLVEREAPSLDGEAREEACLRGERVAIAALALGLRDLRSPHARAPFADRILDSPTLIRPFNIEHRLAHRLAISVADYQDRKDPI